MSLISQVMAADNSLGIGKPEGFQITDISLFISRVISVAFLIAGLLTFAFLILGGIEWMLSGGDKTKTEQARNRITAALVGLAIVAASYAVMKLIQYFFGLNILDSSSAIPKGF